MPRFLQYVLRVTAYFSLTVEPFPGYRNLGHDDYPVSLALEYPERLARWLALARIVLSPCLRALLLTLTDELPFQFWQRRPPSKAAGIR